MRELNDFFSQAKDVRLTSDESARMFAAIVAARPQGEQPLSRKERSDISIDLTAFVAEFPHRHRDKQAVASFSVLRGMNLFSHVRPFVVELNFPVAG